MAVFTDSSGFEWRVGLTVGAVTRLRTEASLDLNKAADGGAGFVELLIPDTDSFVRGLWVLVRGQAEAAGVTRDQFYDRLDGDALEAATTAVIKATVDFFPSLRRSAIRGRLPEILAAMAAEVARDSGANLDTVLTGSNGPPTTSPGLSGSTPTA